jgi:hypothetical protein
LLLWAVDIIKDKTMNTFKTFTLGIAVLLSAGASADFVHTDWQTANDGQVTLDTDTGIEWLKINNTVSQSINSVSGQMGSGGVYEGWRLPTQAEVRAYMSDLTGRAYGPGGRYDESLSVAERAAAFVGVTRAEIYRTYSYGLHLMDNGQAAMSGAYIDREGTVYYSYSQLGGYNNDFSHELYGVFLVSDGGASYSSLQDPSMNANNPRSASYGMSDVSAPAALGGIALLALGGLRRRASRTATVVAQR